MKTLIVKLGALGDVARTTVLLRELSKTGKVDWLTRGNASQLLGSEKISKKYFFENNQHLESLMGGFYDQIINLDEEPAVLEIVGKIKKDKLIGAYLNKEGEIDYTCESDYWFNMSRISKLGKEVSDKLKKGNLKSVPRILIEMIGKKFEGQEYDIGIKENKISSRKIGLIDTCGGIWPNKVWGGYKRLEKILNEDGGDANFLTMKPTLKEHIEDINNYGTIVCGDTLGMHVGLALKKNVVALFNCTSYNEIEDYGRLEKVISPLYDLFFYSRTFNKEAVNAIPVEDVYNKIKNIMKQNEEN